MKRIPLSKGYTAVVDDEDFDLVSMRKWHVLLADGKVYAKARFHGRGILMHRLIMDAPAGLYVDHRDGDGLNNRRSNLRIATNSQNQMNSKLPSDNTSGFKGICKPKHRPTWRAYLNIDGKKKHLGCFRSAEEAHAAYLRAAIEHFGEFARPA